MRASVILAASAAASVLMTTGCSDPCAGLTPTEQERAVVADGGSVEREVNGTECELSDESDGFEID